MEDSNFSAVGTGTNRLILFYELVELFFSGEHTQFMFGTWNVVPTLCSFS